MNITCPKCNQPFSPGRGSGEVTCPHCGTSLIAKALGKTKMLSQGEAASDQPQAAGEDDPGRRAA